MAAIECAGFYFYSDFDSGNLSRVELVPQHESAVITVTKNGKEVPDIPDVEFNVWTRHDCQGTIYENANRTWFYFGIKANMSHGLVKLNMVDLNKQAKMYSQGMAPVYRMVPGKTTWERIKDKPTYQIEENIFTLSFKYRSPDNCDIITYFAFTYPYTYVELQATLSLLDARFLAQPIISSIDDIYYVRECVTKSLENRRVDLITISSFYNITTEKETRLKLLFPETDIGRPYKFRDKKVIFVSARVHPGETPSSFVFNGLLNLLLNREDPIAIMLRRMYVFKMIPFLNPDGVVRGHYRTDTRGVNLNRVYLNPSFRDHPTIFAARSLIRYYHFGVEKDDVVHFDQIADLEYKSSGSIASTDNGMTEQVLGLSLEEKDKKDVNTDTLSNQWKGICQSCGCALMTDDAEKIPLCNFSKVDKSELCCDCAKAQQDSGIFMYLDMHGHASKKGIFMYGNYFDDIDRSVECMLLPKIMSLNNHNFHFNACNFTERNMYLKDRRDGMSREGSGRVSVYKMTGLVRSYTLECNYNTGRIVNVLPSTVRETTKNVHTLLVPPKYTPQVFEEAGKALGASILDLTGNNPLTRIPNSEFHSLHGLQEWLRVNAISEMGLSPKPVRAKNITNSNQNKLKTQKTTNSKIRSANFSGNKRQNLTNARTIPVERKENMIYLQRDGNVIQGATNQYPKLFSRNNRSKSLTMRSKAKRDSSLKRNKVSDGTNKKNIKKNLLHGKMKSDMNIPESKLDSPKRMKVSTSCHQTNDQSDRLKLKEICFVKQNLTKKVIAKFISNDSQKKEHNDDEDLVVAWNNDCAPKVITYPDAQKQTIYKSEPSTSNRPASRNLKATSYIATKMKRPKSSLRRLSANNDTTGLNVIEESTLKVYRSRIPLRVPSWWNSKFCTTPSVNDRN